MARRTPAEQLAHTLLFPLRYGHTASGEQTSPEAVKEAEAKVASVYGDKDGNLEAKLTELLAAPMLRTVLSPKSASWSANYERYEAACDPNMVPCVICGKPINAKVARYWLHDIGGGRGLYLHPGDEDRYVPNGADMGNSPIGENCLRSRPELKPFATRSKK